MIAGPSRRGITHLAPMSASIAEAMLILVAVNAAAVFVMVPLAFLGSALALDGLEKLDVWMRDRESRPLVRPSDGPRPGV